MCWGVRAARAWGCAQGSPARGRFCGGRHTAVRRRLPSAPDPLPASASLASQPHPRLQHRARTPSQRSVERLEEALEPLAAGGGKVGGGRGVRAGEGGPRGAGQRQVEAHAHVGWSGPSGARAAPCPCPRQRFLLAAPSQLFTPAPPPHQPHRGSCPALSAPHSHCSAEMLMAPSKAPGRSGRPWPRSPRSRSPRAGSLVPTSASSELPPMSSSLPLLPSSSSSSSSSEEEPMAASPSPPPAGRRTRRRRPATPRSSATDSMAALMSMPTWPVTSHDNGTIKGHVRGHQRGAPSTEC